MKPGDGTIGRATKKVRCRFEGSSDLVDLVVNDQGVKVVLEESSKVSWKEKLLGSTGVDESLLTDEDFDLREDDAITVTEDGVPSVIFSDRFYQFIAKRMSRTTIVKLVGRKLSYTSMVNRLKILWQTNQPFQVVDLENDYFSVKFLGDEDYQHALSGGLGLFLATTLWSTLVIDFLNHRKTAV